MSSYRAFLALALLAAPGIAQVGGGGVPRPCTTYVFATPAIRGEGFTERTGDIAILCSGGTILSPGAQIPSVNFQIVYNTTVTSRLLPTAGDASTANVSEALLIIDEPGSGVAAYTASLPQTLCPTPLTGCTAFVGAVAGPTLGTAVTSGATPAPNVYQGIVSGNSITFYGVPVLPPGPDDARIFRFTNIRVNAQPLNAEPVLGPNPVVAAINISGTSFLSPTNLNPNVAYVSNSLSATAGSSTFSQAIGQNLAPASVLTFTENFGGAFKTRVVAQAAQGNTLYQGQRNNPLQNVPGSVYESESGFVLPVITQAAGLSDFGTRLKATFNNVPAGVRIFVSTGNVMSGTTAAPVPAVIGGSTANLNSSGSYVGFAQLVSGESTPDGNAGVPGNFPAVAPTATAGTVPVAEVAVANGAGTAVWEVVNTSANTIESFQFAVYVTYSGNPGQNSPFPGAATVNLSYAPALFVPTSLPGSTVPRFIVDTSAARPLFVIQVPSGPALTVSSAHNASFTQGQSNAIYNVVVSNQAGGVPTTGAVTVTDTLPSGLTLVSMSGPGWACAANACTRSDSLPAGSSYPAIIVSVNVSATATSPLVNSVSVSGGGSGGSSATDSTIVQFACLYQMSGRNAYASPGGASAVIIATTCFWSASTTASWIHFTDATANTGSGFLPYSVDANTSSSPRTGTILVSGQPFSISQNGAHSALRFVPVTPCRVADTRNTNAPALAASTPRDFYIANLCGVPAIAEAYSLNLTVVPLGPLGFLSVWPAGQSQPIVSTLNSLDGRVKANAAIVPAGVDGSISLVVTNPSDAIIDINGYFIPASGNSDLAFYPLTPCRIVDTRVGTGALAGPALAAATARTFPVLSGPCSIPATAQAYALNVTAVPSGPLGFVSVWPAGQGQPGSSTLNAPTGAVTANAAIVPAGTSGGIDVIATNPTDLIIDINGYFAPPGSAGGMNFYTTTPCRILDTRNAAGYYGGPALAASAIRVFAVGSYVCGIPENAGGFSLNATVVPPAALGFLSLWGSGGQPPVSTLNAGDGSIVANAALVPAFAPGGSVAAFASHLTHLILDINGYFAQ